MIGLDLCREIDFISQLIPILFCIDKLHKVIWHGNTRKTEIANRLNSRCATTTACKPNVCGISQKSWQINLAVHRLK